MAGLSRHIEGDKAGFMEFLEERRSELITQANTASLKKDRERLMAEAQGIDWARRAVRDWTIQPDGWEPPDEETASPS